MITSTVARKPTLTENTFCHGCGDDVGEINLYPVMFQQPGETGYVATGLMTYCAGCNLRFAGKPVQPWPSVDMLYRRTVHIEILRTRRSLARAG